ncbi:MAG: YncE family protein [bacterium]
MIKLVKWKLSRLAKHGFLLSALCIQFMLAPNVFAYGISVESRQLLSGRAGVVIDEVATDSCVPGLPQGVRYGDAEIELFFDREIGWTICDFFFTDWRYESGVWYLQEASGLKDGPLTIKYSTSLGHQGAGNTTLITAPELDQLIYFLSQEDEVNILWRSDLSKEKVVRVSVFDDQVDVNLTYKGFLAAGNGRFLLDVSVLYTYFQYSDNLGFRIEPLFQDVNDIFTHFDTSDVTQFDGYAEFSLSGNSYTSNRDLSSVRVINKMRGINFTINTALPASSLTHSELHQLVIGSMPSANRLVVISDIDQSVIGEIAVGSQPEEVEASFDGSWLSVRNAGEHSIMTVDIAALAVIGTQSMPEAVNTFSPAFGDQAFYTWSNGGTIYRLRYADAGIDRQVNFGAGLKGVSSNPEKDELLAFYDNGVNTTIQVLNGTTLEIEETQTVEGRVQFVPQYISGNFYKPMQQIAVPVPVLNTYTLVALLAGLIVFFGIFKKKKW